MTTIGEALVAQLARRGVECVFGIPGVHTIELYRGLAASGIRHVTPRHEQGAGFMADGYARVSGKPGVAFVITGPGVTNILTPMAQARADSVPMLVISGVNVQATLGRGLGHLHELPDQHALSACVALVAEQVTGAANLAPALERAFAPFSRGRPGPTHIEVPLDVAGQPMDAKTDEPLVTAQADSPAPDALERARALLAGARRAVILAGGGARGAEAELRALAEEIGAPVVQTVNARGLMHAHPLTVPASPSLEAVRELIAEADLVLAVGTEIGPTDYDMYGNDGLPALAPMIRIDRCPEQLSRHPAEARLLGDAGEILALIGGSGAMPDADAPARAARTRAAALGEIGPRYRALVETLEALRAAVPGALMVGDSTQAIYAGNLYYDHDRPGGWFNSATGYGALGYSIPAAIGAAVAAPSERVLSLCGDGGAQFSLPEIMCAVDENLPITFVIWNNQGYGEIADAMRGVGVDVVGCDPTPPDFEAMARAFSIPFERVAAGAGSTEAAARAVARLSGSPGPCLVEIEMPEETLG